MKVKWIAESKKTAIVALARKLLTIAFHLLRERTTHDPRRPLGDVDRHD